MAVEEDEKRAVILADNFFCNGIPIKLSFPWSSLVSTFFKKNGHTVALVRTAPKLRLPSKVVFHRRSSSTVGRLPPWVVFHWRSSSIESHLPPKIVLHRSSSFTEDHLPLKVIFHQRSSSTEGCLPPSCIMHEAGCNTLVDLIFLRTVNIPNLSLLPCLEVP